MWLVDGQNYCLFVLVLNMHEILAIGRKVNNNSLTHVHVIYNLQICIKQCDRKKPRHMNQIWMIVKSTADSA